MKPAIYAITRVEYSEKVTLSSRKDKSSFLFSVWLSLNSCDFGVERFIMSLELADTCKIETASRGMQLPVVVSTVSICTIIFL